MDYFHFSCFWPLSWLEFVGFALDTSSTVTFSVILEEKEVGLVFFFSFLVFCFNELTFPVCSYWLSMVEGSVSLTEEPSFKGFLLLFSSIECHFKNFAVTVFHEEIPFHFKMYSFLLLEKKTFL